MPNLPVSEPAAGSMAAVELRFADVAHDLERLTYLFGDEALDDLRDYDLTVESDVMEVVERFLPVPDGRGIDGARSAIRTVVVRQIIDDEPPAAWLAVQRMRDAGLERDNVLGQLAMVVSQHMLEMLATKEPSDHEALAEGFDALPMPSFDEGAEALLATARAERGITVTDHVERTVEQLGSATDRRIIESLLEHLLEHLIEGPLHWLSNDVTVVFHDNIAGRVFTHRLSDAEHEMGTLSVSFDLAAYTRFDSVRLPDGSELDQFSVEYGHLAWRGPDGWLDGFQPGDLLSVTATFDPPIGDEAVDASVTISVTTDEPEKTGALATVVLEAYDDEQHEHGLPVSAVELVMWLCHHRPELFTSPLPPLSDWCTAAGLEIDGNLVAHDASVWRTLLLSRRLREIADMVSEPHLRTVLSRAVAAIPEPDQAIDEVRAALGECAEPETIEVLADLLIPELLSPEDEFIRDRADSPGHVFEFVQRATTVARRPREVATAEYLACVLHERCGQPLIAAEHLARAVDAQPRLGSLVERMGWYCFDRGDARGAMRWWRELDEPHPAARTIAPVLAPTTGRSKVGRNDPCWCGSGRKFKQCHLGANELPALPDRIAWLCRKQALWLEHASDHARQLVTELAIAWVTGDPDADESDLTDDDLDDLHGQFGEAFTDPILFDAALHEGGLAARFLRERGDLLPDDERLLAVAWLTVDRSVHEVVAVERGVGLTLRNLATGDAADVREQRLSGAVKLGERYCARVVPDGSSHQIIGGVIPVRTGFEERLLDMCTEGDPFELCAFAGAVARPPRLVHRPGMLDEMLDRDAIEAALGDPDGADESVVLERFNAEIARQAQARWLDENIPALGGLTLREAAADPTRREQVERLLAEFDDLDERVRDFAAGADGVLGGPITYDIAALRRELGLD